MAEPAHIQSVPIPDDLLTLLLAKLNGQELSIWVTEAAVAEAVRQHIISRSKGATLLGIEDYEAREAFFERHGLLNEYSLEMLEMDRRALDILRAKL